jgi:hypothetical protein
MRRGTVKTTDVATAFRTLAISAEDATKAMSALRNIDAEMTSRRALLWNVRSLADNEEIDNIPRDLAAHLHRLAWKLAFRRQKTRKQSRYIRNGGVRK